eukprot:TRINITY_DN1565_c0_g1_i1.p1 TRINITY_DN1565_c0_g1~~TRINITY_DN1565_c0_g1_i1.p1  ORF type:complete len:271 (-),score=80.24 TRINITY_DN1565_c0_g1_i1:125-937(-)
MKAVLVLALVSLVFAKLDRFNPRVVPNGTHIVKGPKGSLTYRYPNGTSEFVEPPADYVEGMPQKVSDPDGWRSSAWSWGTNYTYFAATFTVPQTPTDTNGQCLFFFPSTQHEGSGSGDILQPVLQYNCNGHSGWTMASWYGAVQYTQSESVPVNPGDAITGAIILSGDTWYIESFPLNNNNALTVLSVSPGGDDAPYFQAQNTAQVALEVYGVSQCDMYPSSPTIEWTGMALQDGGNWVTPNWGPSNNPTSCGVSTSCSSSTDCVTQWSS